MRNQDVWYRKLVMGMDMQSYEKVKPLAGRSVLVTGAARRLGRTFALAVARAGGTVLLHHAHSSQEAEATAAEIQKAGAAAHILTADLGDPAQAQGLIDQALSRGSLYGLVNSAASFSPAGLADTTLDVWQDHLNLNLTAPFLLSQAFGRTLPAGSNGRIVNILDWRALRPGADHFAYTISKAALAALTASLALALAPAITVNGLALGAVLPPSDGGFNPAIIEKVPAGRWAQLDEVGQALLFLLAGPEYITGEIIHVDGGRHLV